ncbi:MAG: thioesterase domain-containing protein [Pseudomonadota bacterium]|nr:thioesterase domain-containing protein [Pseudomonadota bacterium]
MSAAEFLSELRRHNIQVWAVGGELRCNAQAGVLTPDLRDQLRQRKNDILEFLASAQALAGQERAIVPLQCNGKRASVFAVPGHNGDVFCYRALAQSLGDDQPFFGLQPPGLDGHAEPLTRVEDIAAYFAAQIRAFQPHGPYIIAGYCAGGTVAFELAQQLLRGGAAISFVALFGSPYPAYFRLPTQLWQRFAPQVERISKLVREPESQSPGGPLRSLAEKLRQRRVQREADQAAALDPVLVLRAKVERATISAVRRYTPRRFAGRVNQFLAGRQWLRSGVAAPRWRSVAQRTEEYSGPESCNGHDMLREPNVRAFAELFRRCCDKSEQR